MTGHCLPDTERWKGARGIVQWEDMITYSPDWILCTLLTKYLSLDRIFLNHWTVKPAEAQDRSSLNNNVAYALHLQCFNSFWQANFKLRIYIVIRSTNLRTTKSKTAIYHSRFKNLTKKNTVSPQLRTIPLATIWSYNCTEKKWFMADPYITSISFPSHMAVIWALESWHLFITVAGSQVYVISTCNSQLLVSKVSGGSWIHLTIAAKKIIKLGNFMTTSLSNRSSSPNYDHKSRATCIVLYSAVHSQNPYSWGWSTKNILSKNNSNLWQILQTNRFSSCCFKNPMTS